jgi:UDP-N-acetylglucosamine 2-epimerase (non-hydrolysing)
LKVLSVFGTRPEAIKLAPVIRALAHDASFESVVCVSGQHRHMLDQVLDAFDIRPAYDLKVMKSGQDLTHVTTSVLAGVVDVIRREQPQWVIVQGDTTTAFAAALAGFYERVPVAHVEAGLRTHNMNSPWPEEGNRRLVAPIAQVHFAPTTSAKRNLLREGLPPDDVLVTGNTVIDALQWTATQARGDGPLDALLREHAPSLLHDTRRLVLVTLHRRENLGDKLRSICAGLRRLADRGDVNIVFPVHLNPAVQAVAAEAFANHPRVHRLPPLDYVPFVALLKRAYFVVTDSGGIQEEAPGLGKPVLVARDTTERPEAIEAGTAELVGTDGDRITERGARLLDDALHYRTMATATNPFGDGHAAQRIVQRLKDWAHRTA